MSNQHEADYAQNWDGLIQEGSGEPEGGKHRTKKARRAAIGGGLAISLVVAGAGGWALDRFVIDHVAIANVSEYEAEQGTSATTYAQDGTATVTDSTY